MLKIVPTSERIFEVGAKLNDKMYNSLRKSNFWYPIENGKVVIEIKADQLSQLFDDRDPTPFREKDLDDDAVEYIVSCAQEVSLSRLGKLRIITQDSVSSESSQIVINAVKEYFLYRADILRKKVKVTLRLGIKSLCIGLVFFTLAVSVSKSFGQYLPIGFWTEFVKEALMLMGWVSMWKPVNIFLYDWWPLLDMRKVFLKLHEVELELVQREFRALPF